MCRSTELKMAACQISTSDCFLVRRFGQGCRNDIFKRHHLFSHAFSMLCHIIQKVKLPNFALSSMGTCHH